MASRLTVFFYILLCLMTGVFLTLLPWWQPWGMGDWGDNFFLVMAAQKTGLVGLQRAVASGWVRGAVTGIGLLNLAMAVWEIFHFSEAVRKLEGMDAAQSASALKTDAPHAPDSLPPSNYRDAASVIPTDHIPHHERRDN